MIGSLAAAGRAGKCAVCAAAQPLRRLFAGLCNDRAFDLDYEARRAFMDDALPELTA
jgi:hypothetical protein